MFNIILIVVGLAGLYFGGEWLVHGSSRIALRFKIAPIVIGLTIVAIGTSAPELMVSVLAAFQGSPGLALGNVIGSNIANIGLILGLTGVINEIAVKDTLIRREIPIMILVTLFASLLILDGTLNRLDGLLLLFGFVAFNYLFYTIATNANQASDEVNAIDLPTEGQSNPDQIKISIELLRVMAGSILLVLGAQSMVEGATTIASNMGISELVIGVTVVAFGTSLPELATSLTAAFKGENDIAVGNVIGSNIANLLLVLGATSSIATINVGDTDLSVVEYLVMIGFAFLLWPFSNKRKLTRIESAIFLGAYLAFIFYSFFASNGSAAAF